MIFSEELMLDDLLDTAVVVWPSGLRHHVSKLVWCTTCVGSNRFFETTLHKPSAKGIGEDLAPTPKGKQLFYVFKVRICTTVIC